MSETDDGIAGGWFTIVLFLVLVILYWVLMVPMYNELTKYANLDIEDGKFSEQAVISMQWNLGLFWFGVPIFSLFGIFVYGLIRAIERKDYDY